jgi:hypothetical protein
MRTKYLAVNDAAVKAIETIRNKVNLVSHDYDVATFQYVGRGKIKEGDIYFIIVDQH